MECHSIQGRTWAVEVITAVSTTFTSSEEEVKVMGVESLRTVGRQWVAVEQVASTSEVDKCSRLWLPEQLVSAEAAASEDQCMVAVSKFPRTS